MVTNKNLCTLSGRIPGPRPEARIGEWVCKRVPGGQAFVYGVWLGSALKGDMSPSSCGPIILMRSGASWIRCRGKKLDILGRNPIRPGRLKQVVRVYWECLAEDPVKLSFNSHLCMSSERVGSMQSEWTMFYAVIVKAAAQSCDGKVTGASRDSNARTCWRTLEVKRTVELKKETYRRGWLVGLPRQQTLTGWPNDLRPRLSLRQKRRCGNSLVRQWKKTQKLTVGAEEILANCLEA